MTFEEYVTWAGEKRAQTASARIQMKLSDEERELIKAGGQANGLLRVLGSMGLSGEAGEVLELHKKWLFHGKPMNRQKFLDEMGDVLWYFALLLYAHGITMDEVIDNNVNKLEQRPDSHYI